MTDDNNENFNVNDLYAHDINEDYSNILMSKIEAERDLHYDLRCKEVGDRVVIWDFTGCTDKMGIPVFDDFLLDKECIVIETGLSSIIKISFMGFYAQRNLLVFCPKNDEFYLTNSNYVKRLDHNKY